MSRLNFYGHSKDQKSRVCEKALTSGPCVTLSSLYDDGWCNNRISRSRKGDNTVLRWSCRF